MSTTSLSLKNSRDWDKTEWGTHFKERLNAMRSKRSTIEQIWKQADDQVKAESFYDNEGLLTVNIPYEKTLGEIYMGRTEGKMNFDIIPDGQANVEELQPTKYAMNFFLDGNEKDNFWKENKMFRQYKWKYGQGIGFTGIRCYTDLRYTKKKDAEFTDDSALFDEKNYEEVEKETWFFFPQAIHPRDFYLDDEAMGQTDVQYAQDCIRKERVSKIDLELRYLGKAGFDQKAVKMALGRIGGNDPSPTNENAQGVEQNMYTVYHYYHRVTKKYIINVDEIDDIFIGRYFYDDGKLPFESAQHYTRDDRFCGEGIPERVAWNKATQSELWQDIIVGSQMNSGINILTGNDANIGQNWSMGRGMNIWRSTGGAENVKQMPTTINLGFHTAILDKLDMQGAVDSGINAREQFDPGSDKVGIVEIMEANKSVRNRSVDENYNIYLDAVLTQMLSRIKQYAPTLLSEKVYDSDKQLLKTIFPKIRIKDYEVTREKGKQIITEAMGKYGYFDLKDDVIQGIGVKVVTPSTNSVLPILERQKVAEYMTNLQSLAGTFQADPEMLKKLLENVNIEELIGWMNDAYGYDHNSLKANTEKDKLRLEIVKKYDILKNALSINPPTDEQAPPTLPEAPLSTPLLPEGTSIGTTNGQTAGPIGELTPTTGAM